MKRPEPHEVAALLDRHGIVPSPQCPPELLNAHRTLIYFILRAFDSDARAAAGMLAAVVEWYRRYDELAGAQPVEKDFDYPDGKRRLRLACGARCNHCCTAPVSAIGPEVALIAAYIRAKFTAEQRASLAARIAARLAVRNDAANGPQMCPLNVDGKCSVYAMRPLNCRKWHSFDESACRKAFLHDDRTVLIPRAGVRADASGLLWQSAVAAFSAVGLKIAELDFIPALEVALADERVAARYAAGEPVFADVER
ncbi:MAG TPA: hypothetical protein VGB85_25365 [Nannocystis sp.]|jgi:hypothetical protein